MKPTRPLAAICSGLFVLATLAGPGPARGLVAAPQQQKTKRKDAGTDPFLTAIRPPLVKPGDTATWKIAGKRLAGLQGLIVSGEGIEVVAIREATDESAVVEVRASAVAAAGFREARALTPAGISNLVPIKVDPIEPTPEAEPNDRPAQAAAIATGAAVVGELKPRDVDYYRVEARNGQAIAAEVEARRLGSPVLPILEFLYADGRPLAAARETPGLDRDARVEIVAPEDGTYLLRVRDAVYAGGDGYVYRLVVRPGSFATGMFPLGGPPGATIVVAACGGNLDAPVARTIALPDEPGTIFDPGPFAGPDGEIVAPGRLIVGEDAPEVVEASAGDEPTPMAIGSTINGRIARPGEVDRVVVAAKKGERLVARVRAAELASRLDSVLVVRDRKGNIVGENDDSGGGGNRNNPNPQIVLADGPSADSRLRFEAPADGDYTIELTDRFGGGGDDYAYRLEVGPARPDFTVSLLLGGPIANNQQAQGRNRPAGPALVGAYNLKPGATVPVNFLINAEGDVGPVEVRAEGLPEGVTAEPQIVSITAPAPGKNGRNRGPQPTGGAIVLKVDPVVAPAVGRLRIVATSRPKVGRPIRRVGIAPVALAHLAPAGATRPELRMLASLPVRLIGSPPAELAAALAKRAEATGPVTFTLNGLELGGPLYQGSEVSLGLAVDPPGAPEAAYRLKARPVGEGLEVETLDVDPRAAAIPPPPGEPRAPRARLRAAVDAEPGLRTLRLAIARPGGGLIERAVPIWVKAPVAVLARADALELEAGGEAILWAGVFREPGVTAEVRLEVEGLPPGVRAEPIDGPGPGMAVRLSRVADGPSLSGSSPLRVVAVVSMPGGEVRAESPIRPMLVPIAADK